MKYANDSVAALRHLKAGAERPDYIPMFQKAHRAEKRQWLLLFIETIKSGEAEQAQSSEWLEAARAVYPELVPHQVPPQKTWSMPRFQPITWVIDVFHIVSM